MIPPLPSHLSTNDRNAIETLVNRLIIEQGEQIIHLALFGSKARGDDTDESDIDVLIVTPTDDWVLKRNLSSLDHDISLDFNVVFNLYVIGQERWAWMERIRHPLFRNIQAEGIPLTRLETPA